LPIKRPQRNLLIVLSALAVLWLVLLRLPPLISLWLAVAAVVFGFGLLVYARDFLVGRYRTGKREWRRAFESYASFEKKLLESRLSVVLLPIYMSIYSFDGVAIARNNMGQSLMNLNELDEAARWLRSALQRDPLYCVPYTNLGTIAALRGDAAAAQLEFRKAVELGFSPRGAQELLRRALAKARELAERRSAGREKE
jgi:tetratricopeptide (TPR) repeat protein